MDQFGYVKILDDVMLPYAEEEMPLKWVFEQDNVPKHTSKRAKLWFAEHMIDVMVWPAQSSDQNAIENLWEDVKNEVAAAKSKNSEELWQVMKTSWASIPNLRCPNLVESMYRRCVADIKNKGNATEN